MKIKVNIDGENKEIELQMKGKHTKLVWKYLTECAKAEESGNMNAVEELIEKIEDVLCEISELEKEQLQDMDEEEIQKLTNAITKKAQDRLGFTIPSRQ